MVVKISRIKDSLSIKVPFDIAKKLGLLEVSRLNSPSASSYLEQDNSNFKGVAVTADFNAKETPQETKSSRQKWVTFHLGEGMAGALGMAGLIKYGPKLSREEILGVIKRTRYTSMDF
ncbi:hypothetical protein GF360_00200 [candidate division WWE3 bacterium]|nr:hypothetical protein [candidate division WWE3 bacterium]